MRSSVVALLVLSCSGSVNDLSLPAGNFATVKGHVDVAAIAPLADGKPVLVAMVWGAGPSIPPICFDEKDDAIIKSTCQDPFGFFPGVTDVTQVLPLDGDGNFTLPLDHLPSASALVGTETTHIAYATLMAVADVDGNGVLNIAPRSQGGGRGGGPGGGGPGGGGPGVGTTTPTPVDKVLAASFISLKSDQIRVSFREGDFKGLDLFYAAPACGEPPPGFSVLTTGAYGDPASTCTKAGLEQAIELRKVTDDEAHGLACRAAARGGGRVQEPQEDEKPTNLKDAHCLGHDLYVVASKDTCPQLTTMTLKGCPGDAKCVTPEWDHTAAPPTWWPCAP